jgi:beta-lactamase class A
VPSAHLTSRLARGAVRAVLLPLLASASLLGGTSLLAAPVPAGAAVTVPSSPVGRQLTWLLSITQLPLTTSTITAHFDAGFLAQAPPAELNSVLASLSADGSPTLVGLLVVTPTSLEAVVAFGSISFDASLTVDGSGLIDGLLFKPYVPAVPRSWSAVDSHLAAIAPGVSLLAARVGAGGTCTAIHSVRAATPRPLGSMFKLFVLGALATAVHEHRISWSQMVTVTAAVKVGGSGTLASEPDGTQLTVEQAAIKMISVSDNTAADILLELVGRTAVEAQVRRWAAHPNLDIPFLTVQDLFALHDADFPSLADHYLSLKPAQRAAYLASTINAVPAAAEVPAATPRDIDTIEWFASADDLCRAFAGLAALRAEPGLSPIATILSTNNGGIELRATAWPTVWFKGGSEPGVLTLGYLVRDSRGRTFVVVALTEDPARAEGATATNQLLSVVTGAIDLLP